VNATFYGFAGSELQMTPDRSFRFAHDGYTRAFATLLKVMRIGEGFVVLTGAPGIGKTTLINDLAARFESDGSRVGKVTGSLIDADDLLPLVAFAFGIEPDAFSKARLLTKLKEQLIVRSSGRQPVILLIDEAQDLSVEALQELYLLFDLIAGRGNIVQILLAGQERLWDRLRRPECEQVQQLIVESCRLLPLCPSETRAYIAQALREIGWRGDPEISADALRLIHERTSGVPRLINLTMGRLLLHGSLDKVRALGLHDVESVLEQMGEYHPELLLDESKEKPPSHPAALEPLLPLDLRAVEDSEAHQPRLQERAFFSVKSQDRNASAESPMDRPRRMYGWSWKWAFAGLSATTVALYVIFANSFQANPLPPSGTRDPEGRQQSSFSGGDRVDQYEPEQSETPLEPDAHMVLSEADRKPLDLSSRIEETEDPRLNMILDKPAIAGFELTPKAHQALFADTLPAAISMEIDETIFLGAAQSKGPEQQNQIAHEASELLAKAELALSENRLTVPSADNAYAYYQAVLARDPGSAEARTGVRRIVQRYRQLATQRLNKRDLRGARLFASRGLKIWPRDQKLLEIKRQASGNRVMKQENKLPEILERVQEWFRSGDTTSSPFLDQ